MKDDKLRQPPVPFGYAVRFATSHHLGGWKACVGLPKCQWCVRDARRREWEKNRRIVAAETASASAMSDARLSHTGEPIDQH
jgi:hypothetical protein